MLQALLQDMRFGGRMLRKNPAFTAVAIAVVALGTGAVSTIFSVANVVVLRGVPGAARGSELVAIDRTQGDGRGSLSASYAYYEQLRDGSRTLSGVAAWHLLELAIGTGRSGDGEKALGNMVSPDYFDVLGARPALGRFFEKDEASADAPAPVVVIGYGMWQRKFAGDSSIVGREILLNGRHFAVIGVAPRHFSGFFPVLRTDAWVTLAAEPLLRPGAGTLRSPNHAMLALFGRLAPGATREAAQAELSMLTKRYAASAETGEEPRMRVFSGARVSRASGLPSEATTPVMTFFAALLALAGLVLLIASVNVASMLLARSVVRRREMAVRLALGASRVRLVRQLLTESVMLFGLGGGGGIALAVWGTQLLGRIDLPVDMPLALDVAPDARVLAFTVIVALVTGIVFGLAPALQSAKLDLNSTLRGDTAGAGRSRSRLRNALVAGQVAMSLLLLSAAGLFVRALDKGHRVDIGFDAENVAVVTLDAGTSGYDEARARALYGELHGRLAALPGVTAVGFTRILPLSMNSTGIDAAVPGYTPPAGREGGEFPLSIDEVDAGYRAVTRIPIVAGRGIAPEDDERAPRVVVVNETFVRELMHGGDAVGRSFTLGGHPVTIVGVARDAKYAKLDERPTPFAYVPLAQRWSSNVNVLVRTTGAAGALASEIARQLRALDPNLPRPTTTTLKQATSVVLLPQRVAAAVTGVLGLAGLLLAAVGLYGVLSFSAAQRTREIGVRVALGAQRRDVLGLVIGDGMRLVGIGMAVGLVLALLATRALVPFLFGVSPVDPLAFVAMTAILGSTALLASWLPARRAAGLDPVQALRED